MEIRRKGNEISEVKRMERDRRKMEEEEEGKTKYILYYT